MYYQYSELTNVAIFKIYAVPFYQCLLLFFRYLAGKFLDGHSTTIVTLMTTLGLFKDDQPLLATNREEMVNRQFKTSIIAPYSTNVGFILYACQTEDGADKNMFKVQLLVDETPMLLPGCDSLLCPYEQVRNSYSDLINNCNMTEICD